MNKIFFSILLAIVLTTSCGQRQLTQQTQQPTARDVRFHGEFIEHFDAPVSRFFNPSISSARDSIHRRYVQGIPSISDRETNSILLMRLDPGDPAGAGRGPEIGSRSLTHFGSYATRIRIPDVKNVQPNVGAVVGYFTYRMDAVYGLSEIDIEWLIADPEIIYVGTWTGPRGDLQRIGRTLNMATGQIYSTSYRAERAERAERGQFTGANNQPETITPIEGFNAATKFYTYGFDWYPDRVVWWMLHPVTEERIILWDYSGTTPGFTGIPVSPTTYRFNFWHTADWSVQTNRNSTDPPLYPYELEIDWMSYTPFEDLNRAWQEQNR